MKKDELPQDMVDRLKREENEANPMVKLRDKIFGAEKKKAADTFEDRTPLSEKIGNKIGDALYPVYKGVSSMVGNDRREAKRQELKDRQKQYEVQDKQEGRKMKSGGKVSSASSRADGCAIKGKTKGRMV